MLVYIYYASCTKKIISSTNRRKPAKINVQVSLPKIWRARKKIKWSYLSFLPTQLPQKKNTEGFGENDFKAFSRSRKQLMFHQEVFSLPLPPCPLINISLDHVQLAQNLYLQKLPCELTVLMVSWAPRAKMWDIYTNREMFLINITPHNPPSRPKTQLLTNIWQEHILKLYFLMPFKSY